MLVNILLYSTVNRYTKQEEEEEEEEPPLSGKSNGR